MFTGLLSKILAGVATAAVIACVVLGLLYRSEVRAGAATRAALDTAVEANGTLVRERNTARAEADRNQAISATALRDNKALDEKVAAIKERLRNGTACLIDPADADALDGLFR